MGHTRACRVEGGIERLRAWSGVMPRHFISTVGLGTRPERQLLAEFSQAYLDVEGDLAD